MLKHTIRMIATQTALNFVMAGVLPVEEQDKAVSRLEELSLYALISRYELSAVTLESCNNVRYLVTTIYKN